MEAYFLYGAARHCGGRMVLVKRQEGGEESDDLILAFASIQTAGSLNDDIEQACSFFCMETDRVSGYMMKIFVEI